MTKVYQAVVVVGDGYENAEFTIGVAASYSGAIALAKKFTREPDSVLQKILFSPDYEDAIRIREFEVGQYRTIRHARDYDLFVGNTVLLWNGVQTEDGWHYVFRSPEQEE